MVQDGEPPSQTPKCASNLKKVKKKMKVKGRTRRDKEREEKALHVRSG